MCKYQIWLTIQVHTHSHENNEGENPTFSLRSRDKEFKTFHSAYLPLAGVRAQ